MTLAVLDASALLALLRGEPGSDRVRTVLADCAISTVNFSEVVAHFARNGAAVPDIHTALDALPVERVPFDEALAFDTGALISITKPLGLSFGDRACLALARRLNVAAMTSDQSWQALHGHIGIGIDLIR